jgi:Na+/citrate or Na+/malate symporter
MNRRFLLNSTIRYFPTIFGCIGMSFGFAALMGLVSGYGWKEAILYIAIPVIGGGTGAGAIPQSEIYGAAANIDPTVFFSRIYPVVIIGNIICIIFAGILNKVGKTHPNLSGNGVMIKKGKGIYTPIKDELSVKKLDIKEIAGALLLSCSLYALGRVIGVFVPGIHPLAWFIIAIIIIKVLAIVPRNIELEAGRLQLWFSQIFLWPLLIGSGIANIDIGEVVGVFNPTFFILTLIVVFSAMVGAGLLGYFLGCYPIEAAIAGGLCMSNQGGSGDLATLAAANRMSLLPFSQISSRIGGGAIMLVIASLLAGVWL